MGAADFNRIIERVVTLLNASDAGTFSSTLSARNKTRNIDEITACCYDGALTVMRVVAATPNEFRTNFITTLVPAHGDLLPEHHGNPVFVEIQKYLNSAWTQGDRRDYRKLDSYRIDGAKAAKYRVYDKIPHNEINSTLSGYFDVWESKFYYTGFAARVGLATVSRADALTKIPDFLEPTVIKFAFANCPKAGEGNMVLSLAQSYLQQAEADLRDFIGGKRQMPEVSQPQQLLPVQP